MPKVAYSEEDRERIRAALVTEALERMARQGIQHTTVEQIYKAVGISRTFFYSFFPTKEDLIVETLYLQQPRILAYAERLMADPALTWREGVRQFLHACCYGEKNGIAVLTIEEQQLISGYTEDVSRFNYGFVHGSRRKVGSLIVGWNEESQTIVVVPTVPDLSGCGEPVYYRRADILKAYRNRYPTDAFVIYPDSRGYIAINAYDWLEDESLYIYVSQEEELAAFTKFFLERFAKK